MDSNSNDNGNINTDKEVLFSKDFTLMVIGQIISLFGNVMLRFSLSLYVLDKTGSAAIFATILAVSAIPTVLLSPLGGILADRVSRKRIMVVLDFTTSAIILALSLFIMADFAVVAICAAQIVLAVIQCFYQPSVQSSIPLLVSENNLLKANGIVMQVSAVANLAGPILGGFVYGFLGITPILIISIICFAFSAIMEIFIKIPFTKLKSKATILLTVKHDLKIALNHIMSEKKVLFKVLMLIALLNFFVSSFFTVGLPYITKIFLGLSDIHYGILQSAVGIGTIIGGVLIGIFSNKIKATKIHLFIMASCLLLIPMGLATISNANPLLSFIIILISALSCMIVVAIYNIFAQTLLQQLTPNQMLGKVASIVTAIVMCTAPIGQATYGFVFDLLPNSIYIIVFATVIAGTIVAFASKFLFKWFGNNSAEDFKQRSLERNAELLEESIKEEAS